MSRPKNRHPIGHKKYTRHRFQGISVAGDIHGDIRSMRLAGRHAYKQRHFLICLGDVIDYGNNSLDCLEYAIQMVQKDTGILIAGNHEAGLYRHLRERVSGNTNPYRGNSDGLGRTLNEIDRHPNADHVRSVLLNFLGKLPIWVWANNQLFVHAAWHSDCDYLPIPLTLADIYTHRHPAVYGYGNTGVHPETNRPIRDNAWVDKLCKNYNVTVGHEILSRDVPQVLYSYRGGRALFLDTGCSKGGRLSILNMPNRGQMNIQRLLPSHILKKREQAQTHPHI